MNAKAIVRSAAAAAASLVMCLSGAVSVSAFTDPAIDAGIIDENGVIISSYANSSGSVRGSKFSIPTDSITLSCGETYRIVPTFYSAEDNYINFTVENNSVADVAADGTVTGVGSGSTVINCTASDGTSVQLKVQVVKEGESASATKVYFSQHYKQLKVGDVWRASASIAPKGCKYTVKYHSDNKSVATVIKTGDVTAVGAGSCTITITTDNGLTDTMVIDVTDENAAADSGEYGIPAEGSYIAFEADTLEIASGEKVKPAVTVNSNSSDNTLKFSSSDTSVAKVSSKGTIKGISKGKADITVTCGDLSDVITVYVDCTAEEDIVPEYDENGNLLPSKVEFIYNSDMLEVGEKFSTGLKIYPKGTTYELTYSSSDTSVAIVSKKGTVKGVGAGTAVITVTTNNGKSDSFLVTVYNERLSGIDVSKWNGDIDWETVSKNPDINFVMIRSSYGYENTDPKLDRNVQGCEKYNIPYGFYHYMYAENVEEASREADYFLDAISGYNPTYPVVLDIEESFYQKMSKKQVTDIVCTFMEKLEDAGYYAMIYSYAKFFDDNLEIDRVSRYDFWVACWGSHDRLNENFSYSYGMWQYSETGRISGCDEAVDLNYSYKNYPYIIKKYGLNGFITDDSGT